MTEQHKRGSKSIKEKKSQKTLAVLGLRFSSMENEEDTKTPLVQRGKSPDDAHNCLQLDTRRPRSNSDFGAVPFELKKPAPNPRIITDSVDLLQRLEMMHERCISRNLRTAGLGTYAVEDENELMKTVLDPNARMSTGETMLMGVIENVKDEELKARYISILLAEGADINAKDIQGRTSLMYASAGGHERAIKLILQQEATDLLQTDNEGNTALMHAATYGSPKILKMHLKALRKCCKINSQQKDDSSIRQVDQSTEISIQSEIRERSASFPREDPLEMQNAQGNTARALALRNCHLECANLLNEERLRRRKDKKKLPNLLSGQAASSPFRRSAKKSAQKFMIQSSSFDFVYFEEENNSDDNLIESPSKPVDGCRKSQTGMEHKQGRKQRIKKRFQSNPDLVRMRTSGSGEILEDQEVDHDPLVEIEIDCEEEKKIEEASGRRRQTLQEEIKNQLKLGELHCSKSRKFSVHTPRNHHPLTDSPGKESKRNLTEKVMVFLRRRSKYNTSTNEPADSPASPPCGQSIAGQEITAKHRSTSRGFGDSNTGKGGNPYSQETLMTKEREIQRQIKKNHSQPDVHCKIQCNQLLSVQEKNGKRKDDKRRSVDLNMMTTFNADDSLDVGQISITPLPVAKSALSFAAVKAKFKTDTSTSTIPRLPPLESSVPIKYYAEKKGEGGRSSHWADEPWDSGLPSSTNSSAAGTSRPMSADSTNS